MKEAGKKKRYAYAEGFRYALRGKRSPAPRRYARRAESTSSAWRQASRSTRLLDPPSAPIRNVERISPRRVGRSPTRHTLVRLAVGVAQKAKKPYFLRTLDALPRHPVRCEHGTPSISNCGKLSVNWHVRWCSLGCRPSGRSTRRSASPEVFRGHDLALFVRHGTRGWSRA